MYLTHGMTKSSEYQAWRNMLKRCYNKRSIGYHLYGGRGITVCDEWRKSFSEFYKHIGPKPSPTHSIDRIDTNRGYEPGNVRWATRTQQQQNLRSNLNIICMGETHCLREWARRRCMNKNTIQSRMDRGWSPEQALGFVSR